MIVPTPNFFNQDTIFFHRKCIFSSPIMKKKKESIVLLGFGVNGGIVCILKGRGEGVSYRELVQD